MEAAARAPVTDAERHETRALIRRLEEAQRLIDAARWLLARL